MTAIPAHSPDSDALGGPLLAALAVHAVLILGLGFGLEATDAPAPTIEVTLARHQDKTPPEESDYIARFNQRGSGDSRDKQQLTTDRLAPLQSTVFRDTQVPAPQAQGDQRREQARRQVVATTGDNERRRDATDPVEEGSPGVRQNVEDIASLRAKLARQRQAYSRIPRTLVLTAASARASDHAEYLRQWIEWVEQIGNENYPREARRQQMYGAIRLAVTIDRQGNMAGVEILESSGQRVLDQAAIRIVRLASPFSPIPETIAEDRVEIIRTWHFIPGDRFHTSGD